MNEHLKNEIIKSITENVIELRESNLLVERQYKKGVITYEELLNKQLDFMETCKSKIFAIAWNNIA